MPSSSPPPTLDYVSVPSGVGERPSSGSRRDWLASGFAIAGVACANPLLWLFVVPFEPMTERVLNLEPQAMAGIIVLTHAVAAAFLTWGPTPRERGGRMSLPVAAATAGVALSIPLAGGGWFLWLMMGYASC